MKNQPGSYAAAVGALGYLLVAAGCASHSPSAPPPPLPQLADMEIVDSINDSGIRSAIITQHTLYGYHFAGDSRELNELGQRDLAVLIAHFKAQGGGELNVRRGEMSETVYASRLSRIQDLLKASGFDPAQVRIADAAPGGSGLASDDVVRAMKRSASDQPYQAADRSASGSDQGVAAAAPGGGK